MYIVEICILALIIKICQLHIETHKEYENMTFQIKESSKYYQLILS